MGNMDLRQGASLCDLRCVRRALTRGAAINSRAREQLGQTALHLAAQWRCKADVGRVLLDAGADAEQRCDLGFTPAERAAQYGNRKMVRMLKTEYVDRAGVSN